LVAFGTRFGTTAKVAMEVAEVLSGEGAEVVVLDLRQRTRTDLDQFELIVLGSSIIAGSWSKESLEFLEKHKDVLSRKKVALFVSCGDVLLRPDAMDEHRKRYLADVATRFGITSPWTMGLFGGEIDFGRYGFLLPPIVGRRQGEGTLERIGPFDFRDWEAIRSWAISLVL